MTDGGHCSWRLGIGVWMECSVQSLSLMRLPWGQTEAPLKTKRIWDLPDGDSHSRLVDLSLSRYLR